MKSISSFAKTRFTSSRVVVERRVVEQRANRDLRQMTQELLGRQYLKMCHNVRDNYIEPHETVLEIKGSFESKMYCIRPDVQDLNAPQC